MIDRWGGQLLLLLSFALLLALSYPWPNFWPAAHVALVPLTIAALRGRPRWRVVLLTYGIMVPWVAWMTSWIRPLFPFGAVAMALYMPLFPAAYVLLLPAAHRGLRLPLTLTVPIVWVGIEWVRGAYLLGGYPYFLQGQSQPTVMIQIADLFGAYGVSFVVCTTNGFVCDLLMKDSHHRDPEEQKRRGLRFRITNPDLLCVSLPLWSVLLFGSLANGVWRINQAPAKGAPAVRVAVVQSNVPQSYRMRATDEQNAALFEQMLALSEAALADGADPPDLIAWPETAVLRPLDEKSARLFEQWSHYRRRLELFAAKHGVPLLVGGLAVPWEVENLPPGSWYNSAFLFTPRGQAGRYDKIHRLPFGEYVPLLEDWPAARKWVGKLMPHKREYWIVRGEQYTVFELPAINESERATEMWSFATPICFEDVFTSIPRQMVWENGTKRVDLLVNISNDGWFAGTAQGPQHEQMARFRCVENRVPMARAVNTGVSGFIDSTGRTIARLEVNGKTQNVTGTATAALRRDNRPTLYGRIGDVLPIGCAIATGLLGLWGAVVSRRSLSDPLPHGEGESNSAAATAASQRNEGHVEELR